jgi:PAS domain S-box-containing protein
VKRLIHRLRAALVARIVQPYGRWVDASITHRVTAALVGVTLVLTVLIGAVSYQVAQGLLLGGIHDTLASDGRFARQGVENVLTDMVHDLEGLSRNSLVANALADSQGRDAYLVPFLHEYRSEHATIVSLSLLDFAGNPVATSLARDRGVDTMGAIPPAEAEKWVTEGKPVAVLRSSGATTELVVGYPVIFGPTKSVEGILAARIDIGGLFTAPLTAVSPGYVIETVDGAGKVVLRERQFAGNPDVITEQSLLALPPPVSKLGLGLRLVRQRDELLAPLGVLKVWFAAFAIVLVGVMFWLSRSIARRMTRPITELSAFASGIAARGAAGASDVPVVGADEVGRLSASINSMLAVLRASHVELEDRVEERTHELEKIRARLAGVMHSVQDVIYSITYDRSRALYVSPAAAKVLGHSDQDFMAQPGLWMEIVFKEDRPAVLEAVAAARHRGAGEVQYRVRVPGGGVRFIEDRFRIIFDTEGRPERIEGIATDVTGRVISEEERDMVEAVLNLKDRALQSSPSGIVLSDLRLPDEPIVYVNPAFEQITGYSATDVYGQNCRFLQADERDQPAITELRRAISERRATTVVLRNYRKDGTLFWNELSISPVSDPSGEITHMVGVQTDISDRLRTQAEIREHTARLDSIFALSPDGFVSFDAAGRVAFVNPAFERMTGLPGAQLLGKDAAAFDEALKSQCDPLLAMPTVASALPEGGAEAANDAAGTSRSLRQRPLLNLVAPERRVIEFAAKSAPSEYTSLVVYFRDVTRETEVDRMKSEFLSTAAHELRTPMVSIRGFSELLLRRKYNEDKRREMTETILRQSERLTGLLNELLDLARIEARAGKDFRMKVQPLGRVVEDTIAALLLEKDGRQVKVMLPADPVFVSIDADKYSQALTNVVSNAYKYSPDGGSIELDLVHDTAGNAGIRVSDHGIGMTPEQLARAFERFFRADTSGNIPGTGLGLSLVKEIMEIHGGRVEMTSEYGRGSQVTLWLPVAAHGEGVLAA